MARLRTPAFRTLGHVDHAAERRGDGRSSSPPRQVPLRLTSAALLDDPRQRGDGVHTHVTGECQMSKAAHESHGALPYYPTLLSPGRSRSPPEDPAVLAGRVGLRYLLGRGEHPALSNLPTHAPSVAPSAGKASIGTMISMLQAHSATVCQRLRAALSAPVDEATTTTTLQPEQLTVPSSTIERHGPARKRPALRTC